jgi:hypothetical protein
MRSRQSSPFSFQLQSLDTSQLILGDAFSRAEYFDSVLLDETVKLVILSTFRLDIGELSKDFPHIFGTDADKVIPTLVLHGDKDAYICKSLYNSDGTSSKSITRKELSPAVSRLNPYDSEEEYRHRWEKEVKTTRGARRQHMVAHPDLVHIVEVLPQWSSPSRPDAKVKSEGPPRNAIPGVHHPKYVLLFTDRGLHVAVSTANISEQRSTDITWNQFFPLLTGGQAENDSVNAVGTDFGGVLEDFIHKVRQPCALYERSRKTNSVVSFSANRADCGAW